MDASMTTPSQRGRLRITQLWRYPVKSLRGESLDHCQVSADGVEGDRLVHVAGGRGLLTGRTRHELLTIDAHTGSDGEPVVAGHRWDTPEATAVIRAAAGSDARLVSARVRERFDVLPLLVATEAEADALRIGLRRLRPNIVIGGAAVGDEGSWVGQALQIGDALVGVFTRRARCVVTTIDPDSGAQDLDVLRRIRHMREGALALDCWTIQPGAIRLGDPVSVLPVPAGLPVSAMAHPGGWITGEAYMLAGP